MNVFELGYFASFVVGAISGGQKGFALYGIVGAIGGTVGGAILGLIVAFVVVFLVAVIASVTSGVPLFPRNRPPS